MNFSLQLFDKLKTQMDIETIISKIKIIQGDCSLLGLGISDEDRKFIVNNVSLVYHCAATTRFDEKLKSAVELNTRGTLEMIKLGLECNKLEVTVYFVFLNI
jgi:alcohol-forming fatty acyl-CoA reductase